MTQIDRKQTDLLYRDWNGWLRQNDSHAGKLKRNCSTIAKQQFQLISRIHPLQRLNAHLHAQKQPVYVMNLDPAVKSVPFGANIDIRDTVDYKQVMKQYPYCPIAYEFLTLSNTT